MNTLAHSEKKSVVGQGKIRIFATLMPFNLKIVMSFKNTDMVGKICH